MIKWKKILIHVTLDRIKYLTKAPIHEKIKWGEIMAKKEEYVRKPDWLKIKLNTNETYTGLKKMMREKNLHTVCEEAKCPNIHECWAVRKTATFMILGSICTRACRFCAVKTGLPTELDLDEPKRVADSVSLMGLKHAVITAVARDDLKDGGAKVFADTVREVRKSNPFCTIEGNTSIVQKGLLFVRLKYYLQSYKRDYFCTIEGNTSIVQKGLLLYD